MWTRWLGAACLGMAAAGGGAGAGLASRDVDRTGERLAKVEAQLVELDRKVERLLDRRD